MSRHLLIVYNADVGLTAGAFDLAHKLVSPATYPCSLCGVTYRTFGMDRRWRDWLRALPVPVDFFHRQDFRTAHPALGGEPLPLIAHDDAGEVTILLTATDLARLTTVDALIAALAGRLDLADH